MKYSTRQALGPLYPVLIKVKGSAPMVLAKGLAGAIPYLREQRRAPQPVVDLTARVGMGALLCHALLLHAWFDQQGGQGRVKATSPFYSAGEEDVFARYFVRPPTAGLPVLSNSAAEFLISCRRPGHIPLAEAQRLFAEHFRPAPILAEAIAAATDCPQFDLSIHYRGTDKFLESGRVAMEPMFSAIRKALGGRTTARVFLATDEAEFAAALRRELPGLEFTSYDLGEVAPGVPRVFSDQTPDEKALESLVNIFLIARAPVCVRTSSYLSAVSALANPELRTITINQTLSRDLPFPERELLEREQQQARG